MARSLDPNLTDLSKLLQRQYHIPGLTVVDFQFVKKQETFEFYLDGLDKIETICPKCGAKCAYYDTDADGPWKRWRALDWCYTQAYFNAKKYRVCCPNHGLIQGTHPWANPGVKFTKAFEAFITWYAERTSMYAAGQFMNLTPQTVKNISERTNKNCGGYVECVYSDLYVLHVVVLKSNGHRITYMYNHENNQIIDMTFGFNASILSQLFCKMDEDIRLRILKVFGRNNETLRESIVTNLKNAVFCDVKKFDIEVMDL